MTSADRLIALEERLAYQEQTIANLDQVVREFATRVESLEQALRRLEERSVQPAIGPADEPPPHY